MDGSKMARAGGIKGGFITVSAEETKRLGNKLAGALRAGDVVTLNGELGCGKTTFVQGMFGRFGIKKFARSASFTLVNEYRSKTNKVYHMDLYRLEGGEINALGLEEYLDGSGITVIEWADRLKKGSLRSSYGVNIKWLGETKRKITITPGARPAEKRK